MEKPETEIRLKAAAAAAVARYVSEARNGASRPAGQAREGSTWARTGRLELMRKNIGSLRSGV